MSSWLSSTIRRHAEVYALNHAAGLANHLGPDREAAQQAEAGQRIARRLGSHRLISLLAMREARSYAVLGDVERFQRALAKAHREFDLGDDNRGNDPAWISFYDPAELLGLEGTCWADVGQYHRAVPLLEQALSRQAPTYQRNRALYQGRLAVARLGHGDPIHAVANATTVTLQLLESGLGSARTAELVRTVRRQVTPYRQEPAVREFATRYDQYATA